MSATVVNNITGECHIVDDREEGAGRTVMLEFDIKSIVKLEATRNGKSALAMVAGQPSMGDLIAMLLAGVEGWNRRNGGSQKPLNPNLAERVIVNAGGLGAIIDAVQLCLAKGEGMGLIQGGDEEDAAAEADAARPTGASTAS